MTALPPPTDAPAPRPCTPHPAARACRAARTPCWRAAREAPSSPAGRPAAAAPGAAPRRGRGYPRRNGRTTGELAGVASGRLCYPCSFLGMAMRRAPAGRLVPPGSSDTDATAVVQSHDEIVILSPNDTVSVYTFKQLSCPQNFVRWISPWLRLCGSAPASQALGRDSGWGVGSPSPSLAEQSRSHVVRCPSSNNPRAALTRPPASRLAFAGPGRSC